MREAKIFLFYLALLTFNSFSQDFWQQLNGPFVGARINDVLFYDQNIIILATLEGIVKSTNGGESWIRVNNQSSNILCLAKDSLGALYAGENFASNNFHLLRSTDLGNSWTRITYNIWPHIRKILITYRDTIYLATSNYGICKSTDYAVSWNVINSGVDYPNILTIELLSNNQLIIGTSGGGVYKSTNGGNTWSASNNGISPISIHSPYRYAQSFYEISQGKILAGINLGVYYSSDYGNNWINRSNGFDKFRPSRIIKGLNDNIFASGAEVKDIYQTSNQGINWYRMNFIGSAWSLGVDSLGVLFAGSGGDGFWKYNAQDSSWLQLYNKGYSLLPVKNIEISLSGLLFAATVQGLFKSLDSGQTWKKITNFSTPCPLLSINDSILIASFGGVGTYASYDTGKTWYSGTNSFTFLDNTIIYDSLNKNVYLASDYSIYKSSDFGRTWSQFATFPPGTGRIGSLHLSYIHNSIFSQVTYTSGWINSYKLFRTTDYGLNWSSLLNNKFLYEITENDIGTIYALSPYDTLLISNDNGNTWSSKTILYDRDFLEIDELGRLYISPPHVYVSSNKGDSWNALSYSGLSGYINHMKIKNGQLYLATDAGIFVGEVNRITHIRQEDEKLIHFSLSQNYPNPFNPTTKIKYTIPIGNSPLLGGARGGFVTLKVFDILGNEIEILVNEEKSPGTYEVTWNAAGLPSGVYFYQLRTGSFIDTKKMVLLR